MITIYAFFWHISHIIHHFYFNQMKYLTIFLVIILLLNSCTLSDEPSIEEEELMRKIEHTDSVINAYENMIIEMPEELR